MAVPPFHLTDTGMRLWVRATPKAGADRIDGVEVGADGRAYLKVRVAAAPDKGAANAAILALVAKAFARPKSAATLASGATARLKQIDIEGDAEALLARFDAL